MKRTLITKAVGVVAVMALAAAVLPAIGAHAGVKVNKTEDTLIVPLPVSINESFYVELLDEGVYTPALKDAQIALHYIMEGQSGDTVIEGAGTTATFCDDTNRPNEVLQISKENAHGQLQADALIEGTTTNAETGADETFSQRVPEVGTLGHSFGSEGSVRILRVCK